MCISADMFEKKKKTETGIFVTLFLRVKTEIGSRKHMFGFEDWIWVLIASVPGLCILFTLIIYFSFF